MTSTQAPTFDYDAFLRRVDEACDKAQERAQSHDQPFDYDTFLRRVDEALKQEQPFDYDAFLCRVDEALKQRQSQTLTFDYNTFLRKRNKTCYKKRAREKALAQDHVDVHAHISAKVHDDVQDTCDEPEFVVWRSDSGFPVHCWMRVKRAERF
jgi:hypothetical protein